MKVIEILLLILLLVLCCNSLHLSSDKDDLADPFTDENGQRLYYPKHYIGHRSAQYKQKVKEENLKKIQAFNNNNRKKLRSVPGGNTDVTGGNSFVMGETKFIEFTEEEFIKLFTGLKRSPTGKHHHEEQNTHFKEQNSDQNDQQAGPSPSQQIFNSHFIKKINPQLNHQTEIHTQSWSFYDPYAIDDHYLQNLYGDVNSNNNWGWDWTSFDNNYYKTTSNFNNDYSKYWNNWQKDHWGVSWNNDDSWFGDWGWGGSNSGSNSWWNTWDSYQSNDNWWSYDPWSVTPSNNDKKPTPTPTPTPKPSNTTTNTTKPIAAYSKDAIEVNWVVKGATTHIKEQGQCGSCWTYSAVGVIQAYFLIKGMGKMDLSEQQLVDCQKKGCYGCDGGQENYALEYAVNNGLVAEEKYPYRGYQQKCAHTTGPHKIPKIYRASGRAKIQEALRKGPVTAAVYVDDGFQFYKKGIFDRCVKGTPNHAVVLVGFTKDYWIVRNSWGADWGEDGHVRIKKDQNNKNACSIEDDVYGVAQL